MEILITIEDFRNICNIRDSYDADFLTPLIKQATDVIAQETLGTALMVKLRTDFNADSLTGKYAELYDSDKASVKYMIAWTAYGLGLPFMLDQVGNAGIYQNDGGGTSAGQDGVGRLYGASKSSVRFYTNRVKKYLQSNWHEFPELEENDLEYLRANTKESDYTNGLTFTPNLNYQDNNDY